MALGANSVHSNFFSTSVGLHHHQNLDTSPIRFSSLGNRNRSAVAVAVAVAVAATAAQGGVRLWTARDIAEATAGKVLSWASPGAICSDTRRLDGTGQWLLAIQGRKFDGHDFISPDLLDRGCVGVIGNRVCEGWNGGFVMVEGNTQAAMLRMATYARAGFNGVVVGVTGSAGKTTTRAMIALALGGLGSGDVYQSPGNWNNAIGVALSLIAMPAGPKAAVLELATGGVEGDILDLARLCRPHVRVILNVGYSHMEKFRSLESLAAAKGEILMEAKFGDVCVLNGDDPMVMGIPVPKGVKKVLFGKGEDCDVRLVKAEYTDGGHGIRLILQNQLNLNGRRRPGPNDRVEVKIQAPGMHLAMDACAAAAVALSLGVSLPHAADALSNFTPISMRSQLIDTANGIRIIDDTYNANFTSMTSAIETLNSIKCEGKKVAVLGDMLELGTSASHFHSRVLELCREARVDLVILVGENFSAATERLGLQGGRIVCAFDVESVAGQITEMVNACDVVLVKGSRAMQMERIVKAIKMVGF